MLGRLRILGNIKMGRWTLMKGQALELSPGASLQIIDPTKPHLSHFRVANASDEMIRVEVEKGDCQIDTQGLKTPSLDSLSLIISIQDSDVPTGEQEIVSLAGEHDATTSVGC